MRRTDDEKSEIIFIDANSENNNKIRCKLHLLPSEMQILLINNQLSYEEKEIKVKEWIEQLVMLLN